MCNKTVFLTRKEFDELPEYSCSIPTGTTIGKKWKMSNHYMSGYVHGKTEEMWWLREYVDIGDPKNVGITSKRIFTGLLEAKISFFSIAVKRFLPPSLVFALRDVAMEKKLTNKAW